MAVAVACLAGLVLVLAGALIVSRRQARRVHAAQAAELERLSSDLEATGRRADEAESRLDAAKERADLAEARADLAEARAKAAAARIEDAEEARDAAVADRLVVERAQAATDTSLWTLELARSERTWRHSVAVLPDAPSPFLESDDPLRLAVEIEAAALHEDTGADLSVKWEIPHPTDPNLLVLRTAQEMLALAAREDTSLTLRVSADDDGRILLALITEHDYVDLDPDLGPHLKAIDRTLPTGAPCRVSL